MGRWDPTYSDAQREAVAQAINKEGVAAPEVIRRAAAGELAGLPCFELPESTARDIAAKDRLRAPADPDEDASERLYALLEDGVGTLEREMASIKERQREGDGRLPTADLSRIGKIARSIGDLLKTERALNAHLNTPRPNGDDTGSDISTSRLMQRITRDLAPLDVP
jgi:hypothetical protein